MEADMEAMMPYVYCTTVTVAKIAACIFLGWCILKGATSWLIPVMLVLALGLVIPARDIFTCPSCGHMAEVKVYKTPIGSVVQKEVGEAHD